MGLRGAPRDLLEKTSTAHIQTHGLPNFLKRELRRARSRGSRRGRADKWKGEVDVRRKCRPFVHCPSFSVGQAGVFSCSPVKAP